ncbi:MAG: site-specific DNA-methyltransferase [Parvibaculaceae bacterium]
MSSNLRVELRPVAALSTNPRNARTHPRKQVQQLARSIAEFGFTSPILIDEGDVIIAGHGRLAAAKELNLPTVPTIMVSGLTEEQKRRLMLADNKIAQNAGWDREKLAAELSELIVLDGFDPLSIGFEAPEIDQLLLDHEADSADPADEVGEVDDGPPISRPGDLWLLGPHRMLCGDARSSEDVSRLCGDTSAAMVFTDPPYNVRVAGIVGRGSVRHDEFAMASGEMSRDDFVAFLKATLTNAANHSRSGAVHFVCMDWRHVGDLIEAGRSVYPAMLNLIAWVKNNAGQGSFYRSQHELIGVFRTGADPHLNNIELGRHGRSRSNVWHYAGVNSFGRDRLRDLHSHPTVKPVAMIADAIKDCTRRGDPVLDVFGGSGSTLLAAERVGRKAMLIELEPKFVDLAIRRWQAFTGKDAVNEATGVSFDSAAAAREAAE